MTKEQVKTLKYKFIFIEYDPAIKEYEIGESIFTFDDSKLLTMTKITLSDYSLLYNAIGKKKMKIPVRLLRILKDELYLFTLTNQPTHNIKVAMIDDERISNDELVMSIGTTETVNINGLKGVTSDQWYRNIVMNDLNFEVKDLLTYAPELAKQMSGTLPINSLYQEKYSSIDNISRLIINDYEDIISNTIKKERQRHPQISIKDILGQKLDFDKELLYIAFLEENQIDLQDLENYLKNKFIKNKDILKEAKSNIRTNLRRLIRIYDYLKGKNKNL